MIYATNNKVYEYLLVLQPHQELWNTIMQIKHDFAETYKSEYAKWGKPHITLVNFKQYNSFENKIVAQLKNIAKAQQQILIQLKDFGSFPSHTIYINITSKLPIQDLVKKIRTATQRLMKLDKDNKPHFILEPHLIIARRLLPWQYEQSWLVYSHSSFTAKFVAADMLLLKREAGTMKYEIVEQFAFENQASEIKQGVLFGTS